MSASDDDCKRDLECLRLASDLVQLASDTLNPLLKAHCLRMAKLWSCEAENKPPEWARSTPVSRARRSIDVMDATSVKSPPFALVVEENRCCRCLPSKSSRKQDS